MVTICSKNKTGQLIKVINSNNDKIMNTFNYFYYNLLIQSKIKIMV